MNTLAVEFDFEQADKVVMRDCLLCGSPFFVQLAAVDRYGFRATTEACGRCGLARLNPRLTAEGYAEFYNGPYRYLSGFYNPNRTTETYDEGQRLYAEMIGDWTSNLLEEKRGGLLVDVGGSRGRIGLTLGQCFGMHVITTDVCAVELSAAAEAGCETIQCGVDELELERPADVLVCARSSDHFPDPIQSFRRLRDNLKDDGLLLIDCVDILMCCQRWGKLHMACKLDHPNSFAGHSMHACLRKAGFDAVRIGNSFQNRQWYFACRKSEGTEYMPDEQAIQAYFAALAPYRFT